MLEDAMSSSFRKSIPDSKGNGWIYNWFCVDHVDYEVNPRRRDIGYHNVYDHYRHMCRETDSPEDGIHFHYHPQPFRREAHRCATHIWASSGSLIQVLSRRVIERHWFPVAFRPGFHVVRPDSHWFLEQYIPFSYASQAVETREADAAQFGLAAGRYGDWRRAPITWRPYHPSHDDYQVEGACRRWQARCLNVGTRYKLLEEDDVRLAFDEARAGNPVILSMTNHDFRDIRPDVDMTREMIVRVASDYPDVEFHYSEAVDAMRNALALEEQSPCDLDIEIIPVSESANVLDVKSKVPTFGPQPWLALKTKSGTFHTDNFDIDQPFHRWQYVLDDDTFPMDALSAIGVAANNAYGSTTVSVYDTASGEVTRTFLNLPK
jgi:hypothetical protein